MCFFNCNHIIQIHLTFKIVRVRWNQRWFRALPMTSASSQQAVSSSWEGKMQCWTMARPTTGWLRKERQPGRVSPWRWTPAAQGGFPAFSSRTKERAASLGGRPEDSKCQGRITQTAPGKPCWRRSWLIQEEKLPPCSTSPSTRPLRCCTSSLPWSATGETLGVDSSTLLPFLQQVSNIFLYMIRLLKKVGL